MKGSTVVLVGGAWHGGWAWRGVAQHLRAAGKTVLTPTLPGLADGDDPRGLSLADTGRALVDLVERNDLHDVTLVAHSWGGYPVAAAAPALSGRLADVVFWSAFVPRSGVSLFDEVPQGYRDLFSALAASSSDNTVALPLEVWRQGFMNDASEQVQDMIHQLLVPQPYQYFTEAVDHVDPHSWGVPLSYVLSEGDVGLPPGDDGWGKFIARLGVPALSAPGSHEALFTEPADLAAALLRT
ncbi:alpha/beta hydrolase [Nakamurella flava]|uniref:Alpha/beta hydrolase n=1 Tax=Nakamurella flava TaxID=2576308 RepID=A0A4U6Q942_9ACTN|nr:alpha/beta fold hydrolase [Nakamurella flava]TKV56389.1 alpha/beta hydrolase [Nakamurella flava]